MHFWNVLPTIVVVTKQGLCFLNKCSSKLQHVLFLAFVTWKRKDGNDRRKRWEIDYNKWSNSLGEVHFSPLGATVQLFLVQWTSAQKTSSYWRNIPWKKLLKRYCLYPWIIKKWVSDVWILLMHCSDMVFTDWTRKQ